MGHYTKSFKLNEKDFGSNGNLKADSVFSFFQYAAEGQVNSLGFGPDDLIKRNYMWVLTKTRVKQSHNVEPGRNIICTTFPAEQKRASFKRDYYINYEKDGPDPDKALILGSSQWCILNFVTRKLEKTDLNFDIPADEIHMIEGIFPKIHADDPKLLMKYLVSEDDIDRNNHCNNARYLMIAERAAGRSIINDMYINFASEAVLGDIIDIYLEEEGTETYIEGKKTDGSIVFQVKFK